MSTYQLPGVAKKIFESFAFNQTERWEAAAGTRVTVNVVRPGLMPSAVRGYYAAKRAGARGVRTGKVEQGFVRTLRCYRRGRKHDRLSLPGTDIRHDRIGRYGW